MESNDGLRATLLEAALDLLEKDGTAPSLRAVARAAGVSAMAPYRHFEDKAALLASVADRGFAMLGEELAKADKHSDAKEALYAQGVAFTRFARRHPALFRLMFGPQYGHAGTAAIRHTDEILDRRVAELVPESAVAAKLASRALVQGLALIELSGRLEPLRENDVEAAIRLFALAIAGMPRR
jgi:AcrR family transcriptional regulator